MQRRLLATLALGLLNLNACVSGPYDGDLVAGKKTDAITIAGLAPQNAEINIEYYDPQGSWRHLKSATADGQSTTLSNGEVWYGWDTKVVVPRWSDGCGYHATSLRARYEDGTYFLPAFSADDAASGKALSCIESKLAAGVSGVQTWKDCGSDSTISYTVLDAHQGDVVIKTQKDADNLGCVGQITGNLTIDPDPTTVIKLPTVRRVTGNLTIKYPRNEEIENWPRTAVEFPALRRVDGSITLYSRPLPGRDFDILRPHFALPYLTLVKGDVKFDFGRAIELHVSGFSNLQTIVGDLSIVGPYCHLDQMMRKLERVSGDATYSCWVLSTVQQRHPELLPALSEVGGNFTVNGENFETQHFKALSRVGGNVTLSGAIYGEFLPRLAQVEGTLKLDFARTRVNWEIGAQHLRMGGLSLKKTGLRRLPGADTRVAKNGPITITENDYMCTVDAQRFSDAQKQHGWQGTLTIERNGRSVSWPCQ